MKFDELQMYFGKDYSINQYLTIHQPTIGEIVEFGEERYYSMVYTLCAVPGDMKATLWDKGIDYETLTDYQLFCHLAPCLTQEDTSLLLGEIDLSIMELGFNYEANQPTLVDFNSGLIIDEAVYWHMVEYIRKLHSVTPNRETYMNAYTKRYMIDEERRKSELNKNKPYKSFLLPLISSMVNSPGFKYKKNELKEVGIMEFMDSVSRISLMTNAHALLQGCYSGMIDATKINKDGLNWMKSLGEN
jgi:hypothetical protein|nr:MAG TPA: coat protein [Caudoviricetes sp.]